MKTKILSILLTVAMLVAMVPAIAVSASAETGKTYEVSSVEDVKHFLDPTNNCKCIDPNNCKYKGGNATGNTMKLTADLSYAAPGTGQDARGIWNGCKTDIDGNGHTVTLGGGYYYGAVLFGFQDRSTTLTMKNLAIVMAVENGEQAVAKRVSGSEYLSFFGQVYNASEAAIGTGCTINVENCYFDVNFEVESKADNAGAGILVARIQPDKTLTIIAKNTYFKANFANSSPKGATGALYGRRWDTTPDTMSEVEVTVENCVFDVTSNAVKKGAVVGELIEVPKEKDSEEYVIADGQLSLTATGTNLVYGGEGKVSTVTNKGTYAGFTTVAAGDNTVTTVKGYQTTAAVDNKFNLRLVGLVDVENAADLANYSKVGFVVVANYANTNTKCTTAASNKVYSSITENTATDTHALTATELGGDYIYALAIKNIPSNAGDITFNVTPYYITAEGTTVYGTTKQFTVDIDLIADDDNDADGIPTEDFEIAA